MGDPAVSSSKGTTAAKMGASGNAPPDTAKLIAALQERKKQIQERLDKRNEELRKLCIEEAELTGALPVEYPFEDGELAPTFRRRIGTSYQLNKNLLNNLNNEEEVLEMEMQMLAKMAQAAFELARESTNNKAARKAHLADYDQHIAKYKALEDKMHKMKISSASSTAAQLQQQAQKAKKKPRPEKEDSVSMNLNLSDSARSDPFPKPFRHSLRSLQHQSTTATTQTAKPAGSSTSSSNSNSGRPQSQRYYVVPDGSVVAAGGPQQQPQPALYKLSLDGYKMYEEHQETLSIAVAEGHYRSYPNQANISRTLPHASRRSPLAHATYNPSAYVPNTLRHPSPGGGSNVKYHHPLAFHVHTQPGHHHPLHQSASHLPQQPPSRQYYPAEALTARIPVSNPLQLQPHQQYEHNVMAPGGLGGYWKQSENGEFWCHNASTESLKDKRFGSLDRRKNKRLQKGPKSTTEGESKANPHSLPAPSYMEATRTLPSKAQAIAVRRHEHRQLVRTQSLGSVGGSVVGGVLLDAASDDLSCGSETTINAEALLRRNKQKEWYETSLDGKEVAATAPGATYPSPRAAATVPPIAPEDKYVEYPTTPTMPQQQQHLPTTPTRHQHHHDGKEIPAESNPSPRIPENLEIFNNNIPKNCTVVQQAQWKPYHEETKPFEMSDFYKYSTKYKKPPQPLPPPQVLPQDSPQQQQQQQQPSPSGRSSHQPHGFRNLPHNANLIPNRNSDANAGVADNFSAEMMNAWYAKHEQQSDNNNATLV